MKKLLSLILFLVMVSAVTCTTYAAEIQKEDLNIDGIYMDQRMSEVFARYGKPDRMEHGVPVWRICRYNFSGGE